MKSEKETSIIFNDGQSFQLNAMNETMLSQLTKGSGENDYKE